MKIKYTIYLKNRNFEGFVYSDDVKDVFIHAKKEKATQFDSSEEAAKYANEQLKELGDCSICPVDNFQS